MTPAVPGWNPFEEVPSPESVRIGTAEVRVGDRVRLEPRGRADIMDLALRGRVATVAAIEHDYDDRYHLAVVVDDDPGRDMGLLRQPGHRFFFALDDVAPMGDEDAR